MKTTQSLLIVSLLAASVVFAGGDDFDKSSGASTGWTSTMTGTGQPRWTVEKDDTAPSQPNVLKQSGEADFPLLLKDRMSLADGFVEERFKAVFGKEDQGAGTIWQEIY